MLGHRDRLCYGAIRDDEFGRSLIEQRTANAVRGAASAHEEDAAPPESAPEIHRQIPHEPITVGVVREDSVGSKSQRIRGERLRRTFAALACKRIGAMLERKRHVHAAAALLT